MASAARPANEIPGLDVGIREAVEVLRAAGVETFESCQGGQGHAFPSPTVRFGGNLAAGWKALAVCLDHGWNVRSLRRYWAVTPQGEPTGPEWEIVLRQAPATACAGTPHRGGGRSRGPK